ncbi:hypothetical protein [Mycobacterium sp.]|uniref:hypothetical protein n=1 Tax=Mycobacterium sp. TaxID=1785 RepID=UPI00260866F6|nr:hypothetical protein [Mycobacterium sp.]
MAVMARRNGQPEYVRVDMSILLDAEQLRSDDQLREIIDDVLDAVGDDALTVHAARPTRWTGDGRYHPDDDSWLHEGLRTFVRLECPVCGAVCPEFDGPGWCTGDRAVTGPHGYVRRGGPHPRARWRNVRYTARVAP